MAEPKRILTFSIERSVKWCCPLLALALSQYGLAACQAMRGPLRTHPGNGRYFTDDGVRAVYLTGSHTWANVAAIGPEDPPRPLDFGRYLQWIESYDHNFSRLWAWELTVWDTRWNNPAESRRQVLQPHSVSPHPWARLGPEAALDGKPKFDLKKYNPGYFDRLRTIVKQACDRGFYVSVMLFEGWGIRKVGAWERHPFHPKNNVNDLDGDMDGDGQAIEIHTLVNPSVTAVQEAYVRKVIDTINEFDNVLFEISNEMHHTSTEWQYSMIRLIHSYEKTMPKQHPVGMTIQYPGGTHETLFRGPADWISPSAKGGYKDEPPPSDGGKVILSDTDHLWGIGGNEKWVWKTFLNGMNPIFMDPYDGGVLGEPFDPRWDAVRLNMGYARKYAEKMNLAAMTPRGNLSSTGYCLANPGTEYLVYSPGGSSFTVNLSSTKHRMQLEWFDPATGRVYVRGESEGGRVIEFRVPFNGSAVLYLYIRK